MAILGIAIGTAIKQNYDYEQSAEGAADRINQLSNEIYKLTEASNSIASITKQYDALDKKLITTIADQEKMNQLLDQAADELSDEGEEGKTDRDIYNSLQDNRTRRQYLETKKQEYRQQANELRKQVLDEFNNLSQWERNRMLDPNASSGEILKAQSALFANNNNTLYQYIDGLAKVQDGVESVAQSILEAVTPAKALALANEQGAESIQKLVKALNNENAAILNSDSGSLKEHVEAYKELRASVAALDDPELTDAFKSVYRQ